LAGSGGCLFGRDGTESETILEFEPVEQSDVGRRTVYTRTEWSPTQRALLGDDPGSDAVAYGYQPFHEGDVVHTDGTYYAVSVTEGGTETVTRPVLEAASVDGHSGEAVELSSLSDADRMTLKCALASADGDGPEPCVVHGGERSAFWPDPPTYASVGGDVYQLSAHERSVTLERYDYSFETVAESDAAFTEYAVANLLAVDFDAWTLSEAEREILTTAAQEGRYRETPPYSDALERIVDAVREGSRGSEGYVRFEGAYYLASVQETWAD
jgi:hypothetical protein